MDADFLHWALKHEKTCRPFLAFILYAIPVPNLADFVSIWADFFSFYIIVVASLPCPCFSLSVSVLRSSSFLTL